MKLTSALVDRTLSQFNAEAIPDDHPLVPRLNQLFGDHTFFLDDDGLSIVEPVKNLPDSQAAEVVKLADWKDAKRTSLAPHRPRATDILIELGPEEEDEDSDTID